MSENLGLAAGFADPVPALVTSWRKSPGHYANIVDAKVTRTGVGVATGVYALALVLCSGGLGSIVTNLSILVYRVRAMAIQFSGEERVEEVVRQTDRRRHRLVPFAAMVGVGIIGVIVRNQVVQ